MQLGKPSAGDHVFNTVNIILMVLLIFVTLFPFWYCLVGSFNAGVDYRLGGVYFWPREFSLENYYVVFSSNDIITAYLVSIFRTIIGTFCTLLVTSLFTYAFSRKILKGRNIYAVIGLLTMYFTPIIITQYMLYTTLGLINNFWVFIFPPMFNFYYVLIMQAFFKTIPDSVTESATIDGASEYRIYAQIMLPLSKPVLAAVALFVGVFHWNQFRDAMIFTWDKDLRPIQHYLMQVIRMSQEAARQAQEGGDLFDSMVKLNYQTIQYATMMVATIPILLLYPFLQKYFVKGIMIGAVKG